MLTLSPTRRLVAGVLRSSVVFMALVNHMSTAVRKRFQENLPETCGLVGGGGAVGAATLRG